MTRRGSEEELLQLFQALEVASDPASSQWELLRLPLEHIEVWAAAAARRRVPRALRSRLFEFAVAGRWQGRRDEPHPAGESYASFHARCAHTVLTARWLTKTRLDRLVPQLAAVAPSSGGSAPEGVRGIVRALATHPQVDLELMGRYLDTVRTRWGNRTPGWDVIVETLDALPHPWPLMAAVAELDMSGEGPAGTLTNKARALTGIDELSGRILVGTLPTWRGPFDSAVDSARDVAGNPDPEHLAVQFDDWLTPETAKLAHAFAQDPDTSPQQLRHLPVTNISVWVKVAARDDLNGDLRKHLFTAALEGPGRMAGLAGPDRSARATTWAVQVLGAARWLTAHRIAKIGEMAAAVGADPRQLVHAVVQHPNVNAHAITTTLHAFRWGIRPDGDRPWPADDAIQALEETGRGPWSALGPVLTQMRTIDKDYPDWRLDLVRWNHAGKKLDALRLPDDHLRRLLETLPTFDGDLHAAVTATAEDSVAGAPSVTAKVA